MTAPIPPDLLDLLEAPLFGQLGTIRPDDTVQVNPMWFEFDGEHVLFTHTKTRAKYRNLKHNPSMSLCVMDRNDPYRFIELRGKLVEEREDPEGEMYIRLGRRYGDADQQAPADKADRMILVMSIDSVTRK